jgi:hypothetical protein
MMGLVKTYGEFVVALSLAVAVLVVFICPLTFGPPAPQQKRPALFALLMSALAAVLALLRATLARPMWLSPAGANAVSTSSERLALICTRLC